MARGIAVPIRTNKRGGAELIQGTPHTEQTIRVGLTPNLSRNPFQAGGGVELGISERIVFDVNSTSVFAIASRQVTQFFVRLREAGIARLAPEDGLKVENAEEELVATVRYVDLEADQEGTVETNLKDALRTGPRLNVI